jgi:hypothetical protein
LHAAAVDQYRALAEALDRPDCWRAVADRLDLHDCLTIDVIAWVGQFLAREANNARPRASLRQARSRLASSRRPPRSIAPR